MAGSRGGRFVLWGAGLLLTIGALAQSGESVRLLPEDRTALLEIQRAQFRAWAKREEARANMLQAQFELDGANAAFARKQEEYRLKYNCAGCEIQGDDLVMVRKFPADVTVIPDAAIPQPAKTPPAAVETAPQATVPEEQQ